MEGGPALRVLTWNLFHGRDWPPDRRLLTVRSRLLRVPELGTTHAQVNRPLLRHFGGVIGSLPWDVALLQEAPPRWLPALCRGLGTHGALALTSRNAGAPVRRRVARWNPDLIGSHEGGSNQILVRPPWRVELVHRLVLARRPERRRMVCARLREPGGRSLTVACVHLTVRDARTAASEALLAAERASGWAEGDPLLLGGDFNLRPDRAPEAFAELEERFGLSGLTGPRQIDHLLASGLAPVERPHALPAEAREVPGPRGLRVRLSDHTPVVASYALPGQTGTPIPNRPSS